MSKKPGRQKPPTRTPGGHAQGLEAPVPSCDCKASRMAPVLPPSPPRCQVLLGAHGDRLSGGQPSGRQSLAPRPRPCDLPECFAHSSRKGWPRSLWPPPGRHWGLASLHCGASTSSPGPANWLIRWECPALGEQEEKLRPGRREGEEPEDEGYEFASTPPVAQVRSRPGLHGAASLSPGHLSLPSRQPLCLPTQLSVHTLPHCVPALPGPVAKAKPREPAWVSMEPATCAGGTCPTPSTRGSPVPGGWSRAM